MRSPSNSNGNARGPSTWRLAAKKEMAKGVTSRLYLCERAWCVGIALRSLSGSHADEP
jgi:hypothetical protein